MENLEVKTGEEIIGMGPYTIDDVTSNAVIVLSAKGVRTVGVKNIDIFEATDAQKTIDEFVARYAARTGAKPANIDAAILGGHYIQNTYTDSGLLVYHEFTITRSNVEEALMVAGITPRFVETDIKAVKKVDVTEGGNVAYTERRNEPNKHETSIRFEDYKQGRKT